jgi:hypothetical protein
LGTPQLDQQLLQLQQLSFALFEISSNRRRFGASGLVNLGKNVVERVKDSNQGLDLAEILGDFSSSSADRTQVPNKTLADLDPEGRDSHSRPRDGQRV